MPHLVLPLSGCLSRRTPTRATRGEARGHRSVLAHNSLLMSPLLFLPLGLSSVWCVVSRWWTGPHVFALLWFHPSWVSFDRVTLWTCGSPKGTQRDCSGCVCVVFTHRLAVWVSVDVGHAHTVAMCGCGVRPDVSGVAPSWAQWLCEVVVGNRGRRATMVTPTGREGVGKRGYDSVAFLRVFVSLRWWALRGRRVCTAWRHTPVMHDDPDCRPQSWCLYPHLAIAEFALGCGKGTP